MATPPEPTFQGYPTVVTVTGELDLESAPPLRDELLAMVNRGVHDLVVDLRQVSFIDSSGVGSLLRVQHRLTLLGGSLHLVAGDGPVRTVLDLMQLSRRMHLVRSPRDVTECCPRRAEPAAPPAVTIQDEPTLLAQ